MTAPTRHSSARSIIGEALVIALIGAGVAFAANSISSKGLDLRRKYVADRPEILPSRNTTSQGSKTNAAISVEDATAAHLKEIGLQTLNTSDIRALSQDARYQQGLVILIDVRNTEHYNEGHVPGAYSFDFIYHLDQAGQILPVCHQAQQVVVYCNGGKCDTSESAALFLRDSGGIPASKLYVYTGGIADWTEKGLPVETGDRNSGKFADPSTHAR